MNLLTLDFSSIDPMIFVWAALALVAAFAAFAFVKYYLIKYKVTYYVNDKIEKTDSYHMGQVVTTIIPEEYGKRFVGWYYDKEFKTGVRDAFAMPNHKLDLYAKFVNIDEKDEVAFSEDEIKRIVKEATVEALNEIMGDKKEEEVEEKPEEVVEEKPAEPEDNTDRDDDTEDDTSELFVFVDADGEHQVTVRYRKSFTARYIQTADETKQFYSDLKNHLDAYDLSNRMSWNYESFNKGRKQLVKINVSGKTLVVYLALDPKTLEGSKYSYEDMSDKKRYEKVPTRLKIRSGLAVKKACELIDKLMKENEVEAKAAENKDYFEPYAERKELIEKDLVKVYAKDVATGEALTDEQVDKLVKEVIMK